MHAWSDMKQPGIFLLVLLVAHSASFGHSLSLPKHWLTYFQWLEKFFKANPLVCLPQVIYPNVMLLSQNEEGKSFISLLPSLPPVIIWRPCQQFPGLFNKPTTKETGLLLCPTCNHRLYEGQWNTGHSSYQPRIIHDIDTVVVLIGITYRCSNGHKILSYDPRIHAMLAENAMIPFVLSYKSGFTKQVMRTVLGLIEQGIDFTKATTLLRHGREAFINTMLKKQDKVVLETELKITESILRATPSRFLLTSAFLQEFFMSREDHMNSYMRSLSTSGGSITIDHTFKVAANIGYFRSDKKWTTQYNSVFIVLNEAGQVLTWKFTQTESYQEVEPVLSSLRGRLCSLESPVKSVYLDNCCHWDNSLKRTFGTSLKVKLDLFHAVQRITRTLSKKNKHHQALLREFKLVFRSAGDVGERRSLPTPSAQEMEKNLDKFLERWEHISTTEEGASCILSKKTKHAISNLKKHIQNECLSEIPPGLGTSRNEALHHAINPYFHRSRMSVQVAYALLCFLFYAHNLKSSTCTSRQQDHDSSAATVVSHDHAYSKKEQFGVIPSESTAAHWGTAPIRSTSDAMAMLEMETSDMETEEEEEECATTRIGLEEAKCLIAKALQLAQISSSVAALFPKSPILNQEFWPFITNQQLPVDSSNAGEYKTHHDRLEEVIRVCGLSRVLVEGDGNCLFSAVAVALKQLATHVDLSVHEEMLIGSDDLSGTLRDLAVKEWTDNSDYYREFLTTVTIEEEVMKFKENGYYDSELGNTAVLSLSNALKIPIIMLTSMPETPILTVQPRTVIIPSPIVIAYNQFGSGHYDGVGYSTKTIPSESADVTCRCGRGDKVTILRCSPNPKYNCRCPCFKENKACSSKCQCRNCDNPNGKHIASSAVPTSRKRQRQPIQSVQVKSVLFLEQKGEKIAQGKWSLVENLLLLEVLKYLKEILQVEPTTQLVHEYYMDLVKACSLFKLSLPVGPKELLSVSQKIEHHSMLKHTFEELTNTF